MNCNSGRKLEVPVCETLPTATVTAFGTVFACMNDLTSFQDVDQYDSVMQIQRMTNQEHRL